MLALSHNCLLFSDCPVGVAAGWGCGGKTSSLQVKVTKVCGVCEDDKEARVDKGA